MNPIVTQHRARLARLATSCARWLQGELRGRGLAIGRYLPSQDPYYRRARLLKTLRVTSVIDVGANAGQYGLELRRLGYDGPLLSFEPLRDAYSELALRAAADPLWEAWNVGLAEHAGEVEINVASNSQSSSILPMTRHHQSAAPHARYVSTEVVTLDTIDHIFSTRERLGSRPYLKIDAQGYEDRILSGAQRLLPHLAGLQLELSLVPMYSGETLFHDMIGKLNELGFAIASIEHGLMDPGTGQQLQVDVVLFKREHLSHG